MLLYNIYGTTTSSLPRHHSYTVRTYHSPDKKPDTLDAWPIPNSSARVSNSLTNILIVSKFGLFVLFELVAIHALINSIFNESSDDDDDDDVDDDEYDTSDGTDDIERV